MPNFTPQNDGFTRDEGIWIQKRLAEHGFDPGPIDGAVGPPAWAPKTTAAIIAFKRSLGFIARAYLGEKTWAELRAAPKQVFAHVPEQLPPWVKEGLRIKGWHEREDNTQLRRWLASDGHALGDPSVFPWCGDFVETAIRLALPHEEFKGRLKQNPYWALNWRELGFSVLDQDNPWLGAIGSIKRNGGGHVFFVVGQDKHRFFALGGNQSNRVSIVPIDRSACTGDTFRWPQTYGGPKQMLPYMTSTQASSMDFA